MGDTAPAGDGDALGPAASLVEESRQSDGQRNPYRRGVYIRRDVYNNGSSLSQKQIGH